MEQCAVSESDLQSLPFRRVIDYIDEGDNLANGLGEVQAELRGGIFGAPFHLLPFVHVFDLLWRIEVIVVVQSGLLILFAIASS